MPCDEWLEALSAWVDGELDGPAAETLEEHLAACTGCRAQADTWSDLRRRALLHAVEAPTDVAEPFPALAAHDEQRAATRTLAKRATIASAALAVAFVLIAPLAFRQGTPPARNRPASSLAAAYPAPPGPDPTIHTYASHFSTRTLVVHTGTTVRWHSQSRVEHRLVNQLRGGSVSAELGPGEVDAVTYDQPGTYRFQCEIHKDMTGTVVVEA